jgi:hypothetical protein
MIKREDKTAAQARARVLALLVAASGDIDARELQALDELGAYACIGVPRERFVALARECLHEVGASLAQCTWLRSSDRTYVDRLLDAVTDPQERLLLCRLAAAAVTADGRVSGQERLIYDHVLARWHVSHSMVTQAILRHVERRA